MKQQIKSLREELIQSLFTWSFLRVNILMIIGTYLIGMGINGIIIKLNLVAGGLNGIAIGIYYLFDFIPLGYIYFLVNVPLLVLCGRAFPIKHLITAIIGIGYLSLNLILTKDYDLQTKNELNSLLLAAVLIGVGAGMYLRFGGSVGGIEILGTYFRKKFSIPVGTTFNGINISILAVAIYFYDMDIVIDSAILFFIYSFIINKVQTGFSERQAVYIITSKPEEIAQSIKEEVHRGLTYFNATSGHAKQKLNVIFVVINMLELGKLKEAIYRIDPNAFITVFETKEVIGKSFLTWEDEGFARKPNTK